jgi:8-oxo-dGTP pyrophosphatase MutT (NUDIX family)
LSLFAALPQPDMSKVLPMDRLELGAPGRLLKAVTLIMVIDREQRTVLLGRKSRGFGSGKWNGFGGKVDPTDANVRDAAVRELHEESGLRVADPAAMARRAVAYFQYPMGCDARILETHLYTVDRKDVTGDVVESEEMNPIRWVPFADVPLAEMWADDAYWLPQLLAHACPAAGAAGPPADDDTWALGQVAMLFLFASFADMTDAIIVPVTRDQLDELRSDTAPLSD